MTGCLRPVPTNNFFVLAGIQPSEGRRQKTTFSLAFRAQDPEYLLRKRLVFPSCGHMRQLQIKSRHRFVPAPLELLNDLAQLGTSVVQ